MICDLELSPPTSRLEVAPEEKRESKVQVGGRSEESRTSVP